MLFILGESFLFLQLLRKNSGKLALSAARDKRLKMWNLLKGKSAYSVDCPQVIELLKWSPQGDYYAAVSGSIVSLFDSNGQKFREIELPKQVLAVAFLDNEHIVTGGNDNKINIWRKNGECLETLSGHTNRYRHPAIS